MEMGWCEQYEIVMYFNEGGRTAFFGPLGGCAAARVLACPAAKKAPPYADRKACPTTAPCRGASKRKQKIVWAQLLKSMAGDEHSGGQDWHPSAGMRYRLGKSEMGISRQWRVAL